MARKIADTKVGPHQHQDSRAPGQSRPVPRSTFQHPSDLPQSSLSSLVSADPKVQNLPQELRAAGGPGGAGSVCCRRSSERPQGRASGKVHLPSLKGRR